MRVARSGSHVLVGALVLFALLFVAAGCGRGKIVLPIVLNQAPTVRLSQAPASASTPYSYAYEFFWTGFDPDGSVEYYLYAVDPPTRAHAETTWIRTTDTRVALEFRSDDPDSLGTHRNPGGFHVFAIRAIDNSGTSSLLETRAFYSYTIAPTVKFISPIARALLPAVLTPTTRITWTGDDPDGRRSHKPVQYKYRLFPEAGNEFPFLTLLYDPDSLRRYYAPEFAGWDSIAGDTVQVLLSNMVPGNTYALVVVAFDEAGAYSPVFSFDGNMLNFTCTLAGALGPRLTLWNEYFSYTYVSGGYLLDPATFIRIQVPSNRKLTFSWAGVPGSGRAVKQYRWAVDIERLDDETPRSNEHTDLQHWSTWSLFNTSAVTGPFAGGDEAVDHYFYVEAVDDAGFKSLGTVQFHVVEPSFTKDLLFIDDTRRAVDQRSGSRPDSVISPGGYWPSRAELDTFFFARGGVRWRSYPVGTLSAPGIFKGYSFDTVATRSLAGGNVPLATLGAYRHIVWYTDQAPDYVAEPENTYRPMTALRLASTRQLANTLGIYSSIGGQMWLMGGGIAYNSLIPFNLRSNDAIGTTAFSNDKGELISGRLMFDFAQWQSEIRTGGPRRVVRNPGLAASWSGAPDYAQLPERLEEKRPATDPIAPLRSATYFYLTEFEGEALAKPNEVIEDVASDPSVDQFESVLDTLYFASSGSLNDRPIMTYYHGTRHGGVVFSGFPLWYFQRAQAIDLADFVLQRVWGLQRQPVTR